MNIIEPSKQIYTDIDSCYSYIKESLLEPDTALNLLLSIDKKVKQIIFVPEAYPLVNNRYLASQGVRASNVKKYTLFYRFNAENKVIELLRFLPGGMDWAKVLTNDFKDDEG